MALRDAELKGLLAKIGHAAAAYYRRGFDEGGVVEPWPDQYEGSPEPFVHVAGLVRDLNRGVRPKARRFSRGQVGVDTGALRRSIAAQVIEDEHAMEVEVGSSLPYAGRFHEGGESVIPFERPFRRSLYRLLRRRPEYRGRLGWLFSQEELRTQLHRRPLVGWTDDLRDIIEDVVLRHYGARPA